MPGAASSFQILCYRQASAGSDTHAVEGTGTPCARRPFAGAWSGGINAKVVTLEKSDEDRLVGKLPLERGIDDPFVAAIHSARMPVILTDPRQDDNPIVYVNDAFCRMTGYSREESVGRNCRFLQGPGTDPVAVEELRQAIEREREISIELLNYRKDGRTFRNAIHVSPVSAADGELQFFFSTQVDMSGMRRTAGGAAEPDAALAEAVRERTAELERALDEKTLMLHEVDHRVKNNLQMISAMMRKQLRLSTSAAAQEALRAALSRVDTLGVVHRRLYQSADLARFSVAQFIGETIPDLLRAADRSEVSLDLDLEDFTLPAKSASAFALLVNELVTNALEARLSGKGPEGPHSRADAGRAGFHHHDDRRRRDRLRSLGAAARDVRPAPDRRARRPARRRARVERRQARGARDADDPRLKRLRPPGSLRRKGYSAAWRAAGLFGWVVQFA